MRISVIALLAFGAVVLMATVGRPAGEARAAANQLLTEQRCSGQGVADVAFVWTGNGLMLTEQWFDISSSSNSFAPGTYTGIHLAGGWVQSHQMSLDDAATFYVRLNQLNVNGQWDPSPAFTVNTIACPRSSYAVVEEDDKEEKDERRSRIRRTDQLTNLQVILLINLICNSDEADEDLQDLLDICDEDDD
jgi:hypothetical protein